MLSKLKNFEPLEKFFLEFEQNKFPINLSFINGSLQSLVFISHFQKFKQRMLLVFPSDSEAKQIYNDFKSTDIPTGYIPPLNINAYHPLTENESYIMSEISKIVLNQKGVFFTSVRGLVENYPPKDYVLNQLLKFKINDDLDFLNLSKKLEILGYTNSKKVIHPNTYRIKGDIVEIFLSKYKEPIRIHSEFEKIISIKFFSPLSQISSKDLKEELLIYPSQIVNFYQNKDIFLKNLSGTKEISKSNKELIINKLKTYKMQEIDKYQIYYPLCFENKTSLLDYFDGDCLVFFEHERLQNSYKGLLKEHETSYQNYGYKEIYPSFKNLIFEKEELEKKQKKVINVFLNKKEDCISFLSSESSKYFGNIRLLKEELKSLIEKKIDVLIYCKEQQQKERIQFILKDFLNVFISQNYLSEGFSIPAKNLYVLTDSDIFSSRKKISKSYHKAQLTNSNLPISSYLELKPGDFVVHIHYGIGKFLQIVNTKVRDGFKDFIKLEYKDENILYIPIESINLVQKYIGQNSPSLDSLGSKSWLKRKQAIKSKIEDLTDKLLSLYTQRMNSKGFAFSYDNDLQVEFEADFPFVETQDQLKCIKDIKDDMQAAYPMDRLICGDVGFGKTELALRACFKAILDNKQVLILAPTTILSEQHYNTALRRMEKFGIRIAYLSRLVERKKQKQIIQDIKDGNYDLIIGTHKIIQKDVFYKDLGLIVIDEEQRFGVKDKEKLKQLKVSVDFLSLSATPIPRTLYMSLSGIRDLSIINTAPYNRQAVETRVLPYSENLIRDIIEQELARDGQVFFLHNKISELDEVVLLIQKLVPYAIVDSAHGQLDGKELESIMSRFIGGYFQVLVSTTIIENGIDIPSVNTIIINDAGKFGLSQLYQLKGRVGRSEKLGYAYLLYDEHVSVDEIAQKRLDVIEKNTELGSGIKVAMMDMEIRGVGNIFGSEQSGDVFSVGFDMYMRMLDENIKEKKGEVLEDDIYVDISYSGYVPDDYMDNNISLKIDFYKKLSYVKNEDELQAIEDEMIDRFGPLPKEAQILFLISNLKITAKKIGVSRIFESKDILYIEFSKLSKIDVEKTINLINNSNGNIQLNKKQPNILDIKLSYIENSEEKLKYLQNRLAMLL